MRDRWLLNEACLHTKRLFDGVANIDGRIKDNPVENQASARDRRMHGVMPWSQLYRADSPTSDYNVVLSIPITKKKSLRVEVGWPLLIISCQFKLATAYYISSTAYLCPSNWSAAPLWQPRVNKFERPAHMLENKTFYHQTRPWHTHLEFRNCLHCTHWQQKFIYPFIS